MKSIIYLLTLICTGLISYGQSLYSRAFGDKDNPAVFFLHGGPGFNCANFEATTAQRLADNGYYVIVYDRRGEGRSAATDARFTFEQTFEDLEGLYREYDIDKAALIGHSFGGMVASLFADRFPERTAAVILVGAPVNLQESFAHIIAKSRTIYETRRDSANLQYLAMLETMDKSSLPYSSFCFLHAMQNGFYSPKNPTAEAKALYAAFRADTALVKYGSQMTPQPTQGFWQNEHYTTLDMTATLQSLTTKGVPLYGIYGKEDGLYSEQQVMNLQALIGVPNLLYLDNCSHNVFIDQQSPFIEAITAYTSGL